MYKPENEDKLEQLEGNLYSRTEKPHILKSYEGLRRENVDVNEDWKREKTDEDELKYYPKKISAITRRILIFSLLFLLIALSFGAYIYFKGSNVFSSSNIDISITGPVNVDGGEKLVLDIAVKNNNNTNLEEAILKIEYPEGVRNPQDISKELRRQQEALGEIKAGGVERREISAVLFGEENSKKEIKLTVEYRVRDSNAIYEKSKVIEVSLSSAPLSISVEGLKEINSGQSMEFSIEIASNSAELLRDVVFRAEYPFGYTYGEASPKPTYGTDAWKIGDLKPGEKKKIKIRGQIQGQDGEERNFRFSAGLQSKKDEKLLEPEILTVAHSIVLNKPFIGLELALNGQTSSVYVAEDDNLIRGDLSWRNNVPSEISDLQVEVEIAGDVDEKTVSVSRGFYRSLDNTVIWNSGTLSDLRVIEPGQSGRLSFSFSPLLKKDVGFVKNGEITLSVSVKAKRRGDVSVPEELVRSVVKKVQMQTGLSFGSGISYYSGPFKNTGPLPPKVETETTYTATFSVGSSSNDARDAEVTARLPLYVKWLGEIYPESEVVEYNASGGNIVWKAGEIRAGDVKQLSFKISILPSVSQVGTLPVLVSDIKVKAVDRFTNTEVRYTGNNLTTSLVGDAGAREGDEKVNR